ncbi:MAG: phosphoribosylformylglycinamidine synthase, partial [Chloroflexi bacterium]|nr:phosphoribosylformylglycinamidine synthase [Chloroflexota bacterium]
MTEMKPDAALLRTIGLSSAEYDRILELLERTPTEVELGMFGAMWSEHCGYKNSRPLLKRFPNSGPGVLQGPGENAGAVSLGGGLALVLKVESHNHPSAIEPYQGAATGVGGILRDIFTMGARPIAMLDSLRFGLPSSVPGSNTNQEDDARLRHLFHGIVAGVGGYGNCMGVPTVGGETIFEPCYTGNPLVNAMCVGVVEESKIVRTHAGSPGNLVVLVGAATGRDGIHGATFASVELDEKSDERRPAVQVGDPLTEKLLLEACLDLRDRQLVAGMQDLGAAGLTSSTVEMADKTGTGIELDLSLVPRRAPGMTPYELMLSESQERMLVAVEPAKLGEVEAVLDHWELPHAVIGIITADGQMRVRDGATVVADVPVKLFTDGCPVYIREGREDEELRAARELPLDIADDKSIGDALLALLAHPNIGSKLPVWQQYDHMVQTNTVVAPGSDAAVLRLKGRNDAIALAIDGNGRRCQLEPYSGGALAVLEAARNIACVGARPLCVTDCLNFGNPEKPGVYYQLEQAIMGMADACRALGIAVVSGNVSLFNESQTGAIYPTPVVGIAGQIDDVTRVCTPGFKQEGDEICLLGAGGVSVAGSVYAQMQGLPVSGHPAPLDIELECRVQTVCRQAIEQGMLSSAHDCSDGGLAVTLVESALAGNIGASIDPLPDAIPANIALFGEGPARIIVSLPAHKADKLAALAESNGVPLTRL